MQEKLEMPGHFMLRTAVFMGDRNATMLFLVNAYRGFGTRRPFPAAYTVLEKLAEQDDDIGVMCLRAEMLMWPQRGEIEPVEAKRSEAYHLALQAFDRSEAGAPVGVFPVYGRASKPVAVVPDLDTVTTLPWIILQRMAENQIEKSPAANQALWEKATAAGARMFDDPRACAQMAKPPSTALVSFGSDEWVKFATKAAMDGKGEASSYLGRYYLELHGWYPVGNANRKRDTLGFQWMEVAMHHERAPDGIQRIALHMALLCRHNGDMQAGHRWLEMGVERLDASTGMKHVDTGPWERAIEFLQDCQKDWHLPLSELPATWTDEIDPRRSMARQKQDLHYSMMMAEYHDRPILSQVYVLCSLMMMRYSKPRYGSPHLPEGIFPLQ